MWQYLLISTLLISVIVGISVGAPPQARSVPFSPAPVSRDVMERNKKAALEFYDLAINKKDYLKKDSECIADIPSNVSRSRFQLEHCSGIGTCKEKHLPSSFQSSPILAVPIPCLKEELR